MSRNSLRNPFFSQGLPRIPAHLIWCILHTACALFPGTDLKYNPPPYLRKLTWSWMIWEYLHFRKPPSGWWFQRVSKLCLRELLESRGGSSQLAVLGILQGTPWTIEGSTACRKLQLRCIPKRWGRCRRCIRGCLSNSVQSRVRELCLALEVRVLVKVMRQEDGSCREVGQRLNLDVFQVYPLVK